MSITDGRNGKLTLSEKGLLTPDTCVLALIDHQPQMLLGVDKYRGPPTKVIDARERTVIPRLYDSHLHLICGGLTFNMQFRWNGSAAETTVTNRPSDGRIAELSGVAHPSSVVFLGGTP